MNSNNYDRTETNGANIKPSARKSIYSNCNSSYHSRVNMARYGLIWNREQRANAPKDEVDNSMRSGSCIADLRNTSRYRHFVPKNTSALRRRIYSGNNSRFTSLLELLRFRYQEQKSRFRRMTGLPGSIIFAVITILLAIYFAFKSLGAVNNTEYDKLCFCIDIKALGVEYKINNYSILELPTGYEMIHKQKQDTASFLFVYNSSIHNFRIKRVNDFSSDVASATFFRTNRKAGHVVVDSSGLKGNRTGIN